MSEQGDHGMLASTKRWREGLSQIKQAAADKYKQLKPKRWQMWTHAVTLQSSTEALLEDSNQNGAAVEGNNISSSAY